VIEAQGAQSRAHVFLRFLNRYGILFVFLFLIVIVTAIQPQFVSPGNLIDILTVSCIYLMISFGETFVIATGGIDLSVGNIAGFSALATSLFMTTVGMSVGLSVVLGVLTGLGIGAVNGFIVGWMGVDSFVATLSTMFVIIGVKYWMTGGMSIMYLPGEFRDIGRGSLFAIPYTIYILIAGTAFSYILLHKLKAGRYMYLIGGNIRASYLSGVPVRFFTMLSFILSGSLSSVTGILLSSRGGSTNITLGESLVLDAISISLLGGVLSGGKVSIIGTLMGGLFLMLVINGLNMLGVDPASEQLIKGMIVLILVVYSLSVKSGKRV